MGKIVTFANQKGGVGKTTSCVSIAAAVADKGKKVLICDIDPQGNATSGVGINKKDILHSTYDTIIGRRPASEAVLKTEFKNLDILPANINLAGAEFELVTADHRETRLKQALDSLREQYDYIFVDCPPSLGVLTINAIVAADGIVIPMQCEFYALEGLTQLMVTLKKIKQLYNPALEITGILITMYNGRLNLSAQVISELKKYYADKLFKTAIIRNVRISEAPGFGMPVHYFDKYSKGAKAYEEAAEELMMRI